MSQALPKVVIQKIICLALVLHGRMMKGDALDLSIHASWLLPYGLEATGLSRSTQTT